MNKDDLILISVDDHIVEPADMFDAHVPAKYKDLAPGWSWSPMASSSGTTARFADGTWA
jgi:hypothetical protein